MGGIIVVDFIDMHNSVNRKKLYDAMVEFMKDDKAKHHILPPSKFGLIEITRQRVRPEMNIETKEGCPTCQGTGKVEASILIIDEIEQKLAQASQKYNNIILKAHPFVQVISHKVGLKPFVEIGVRNLVVSLRLSKTQPTTCYNIVS